MAKQLRTITVGELKELLDGEPDDARVIFTTGYGDHGNTDQALPIRGELQAARIKESGYSNSGFAIVDFDGGDPDEDDDNDGEKFLVIF